MKTNLTNAVEAAKKIKAILFDVDGVLTDGGIIYDNNGVEYKRYNVKDGQIISHLQKYGFVVGAITGRNSDVVKNRCEELKMDFHRHGVKKKLDVFEEFKLQFQLDDSQIVYIGDDIIDLAIIKKCGLGVSPADAREYIHRHSDMVTLSNGGDGVLRDVADYILDAQGLLEKIIQDSLHGK